MNISTLFMGLAIALLSLTSAFGKIPEERLAVLLDAIVDEVEEWPLSEMEQRLNECLQARSNVELRSIEGDPHMPEIMFAAELHLGEALLKGVPIESEREYQEVVRFVTGWDRLGREARESTLAAEVIRSIVATRARNHERRRYDFFILGAVIDWTGSEAEHVSLGACFGADSGFDWDELYSSKSVFYQLFALQVSPEVIEDTDRLASIAHEAIDREYSCFETAGYRIIAQSDISNDEKVEHLKNAIKRNGWPVDDGSHFSVHQGWDINQGIAGGYSPGTQLTNLTGDPSWRAKEPQTDWRVKERRKAKQLDRLLGDQRKRRVTRMLSWMAVGLTLMVFCWVGYRRFGVKRGQASGVVGASTEGGSA